MTFSGSADNTANANAAVLPPGQDPVAARPATREESNPLFGLGMDIQQKVSFGPKPFRLGTSSNS
jgi:hypothetical protein